MATKFVDWRPLLEGGREHARSTNRYECRWRWGAHWAHGRIEQVYGEDHAHHSWHSDNANANLEEPAYLITQARGGVVLKNGNEITQE